VARNHHSWKKRVKELARKEKAEEKRQRRQNKGKAEAADNAPEDPGEHEAQQPEADNVAAEEA
jgi:hypothetical protein